MEGLVLQLMENDEELKIGDESNMFRQVLNFIRLYKSNICELKIACQRIKESDHISFYKAMLREIQLSQGLMLKQKEELESKEKLAKKYANLDLNEADDNMLNFIAINESLSTAARDKLYCL